MIKTKDHFSEKKCFVKSVELTPSLSIGEKSYHYSYHLDDFSFLETFIAAAL